MRDGLLVHRSPEILARLLTEISNFAESGGVGAVHLGDVGCGGGGFDQPPNEHVETLRTMRALEAAALPPHWPIYHMPGNHDVAPSAANVGGGDGLAAWREHLGPRHEHRELNAANAANAATGSEGSEAEMRLPAYQAFHVGRHWKLLLLDSMDSIPVDRDGHGHIGHAQLAWLDSQLASAERQRLRVVVCAHQLFIDPTTHKGSGSYASPGDAPLRRRARIKSRGASAGDGVLDPASFQGPSWIASGDMVDNHIQVLEVLSRYPGVVRLSLHGHVHANTLVSWKGIDFLTLASTSEYPMQWFELHLRECDAQLTARHLALPHLRDESEKRDNRPMRNAIKRGMMRNDTHAGVEAIEEATTTPESLGYEWDWPCEAGLGSHGHGHRD